MDHEQNELRRYTENTDRLYFCLIGLGVCSVATMWAMIVNQLTN